MILVRTICTLRDRNKKKKANVCDGSAYVKYVGKKKRDNEQRTREIFESKVNKKNNNPWKWAKSVFFFSYLFSFL